MNSQNLSGLLDRVKGGDVAAADQLHRVLRPVVSREVRRILRDEEFTSPLGKRVEGLLFEVGRTGAAGPVADFDTTAVAIAQSICRQTVARLKLRTHQEICSGETILA
jgi:hypothetical protein